MKSVPWRPATGDSYHTEKGCIHGRRVQTENRRDGTGE